MKRRDFLGLSAAFAAAGCVTGEKKAVDAGTRATPVVPWRPFPDAKKVRVVQWGMCHEHADGKFKSVKKLPTTTNSWASSTTVHRRPRVKTAISRSSTVCRG